LRIMREEGREEKMGSLRIMSEEGRDEKMQIPNYISCRKYLVAHLTHLAFLSEAIKGIQ